MESDDQKIRFRICFIEVVDCLVNDSEGADRQVNEAYVRIQDQAEVQGMMPLSSVQTVSVYVKDEETRICFTITVQVIDKEDFETRQRMAAMGAGPQPNGPRRGR